MPKTERQSERNKKCLKESSLASPTNLKKSFLKISEGKLVL